VQRAIEQTHNKAVEHIATITRSLELCIALDANDITQLFCYIIRAIESRVTIWSWLTLLARGSYIEWNQNSFGRPSSKHQRIISKERCSCRLFICHFVRDSSAQDALL
jgi:hypothetical protein